MPISIDEMLDLLNFAGSERANGNANHGPMAAEALLTLDRSGPVLPWVERYKSGLIEAPETTDPIPRSEWRATLGDRRRLGDSIAFFDRESLKRSPGKKPCGSRCRLWRLPSWPRPLTASFGPVTPYIACRPCKRHRGCMSWLRA
jgi:hypothetical protein